MIILKQVLVIIVKTSTVTPISLATAILERVVNASWRVKGWGCWPPAQTAPMSLLIFSGIDLLVDPGRNKDVNWFNRVLNQRP